MDDEGRRITRARLRDWLAFTLTIIAAIFSAYVVAWALVTLVRLGSI